MKKIKFFAVTFFVVLFSFALISSAHSQSQSGVLKKTYLGDGRYVIGSENAGWALIEEYHTNGTKIYYKFDSSFTDANLKAIVRAGAALWNAPAGSGLPDANIEIIESSYYATGTIYANYVDIENVYVARVYDKHVAPGGAGHLNEWKMELNTFYSSYLNAQDVAHEFGHVIGLTDLYTSRNRNKIMYYDTSSTATAPTQADVNGAKVITGQHETHTWGCRPYETSASGNTHCTACTVCSGIKDGTSIVSCTNYNSRNICVDCGMPKNMSLNQTPDIPELQ